MNTSNNKLFDLNIYLDSLSKNEREKFLLKIGETFSSEDLCILKKGKAKKRKDDTLKKYRDSWKIIRCEKEDLEEEWVNYWWVNGKKNRKNKITIGYQDIILGYDNIWTAITGTDCEWFPEQESLQKMIEVVKYHNQSGMGEWGVGTIGESHEYVNRVFIEKEHLKHFENELEVLKKRYKKIYIMDYYNPI